MASKRLRKTLPKDLPALIEAAAIAGDYAEVHQALEACQVDARGGYGKGTPLMMRPCTPELARFARGTEVNATDTHDDNRRSPGCRRNLRWH